MKDIYLKGKLRYHQLTLPCGSHTDDRTGVGVIPDAIKNEFRRDSKTLANIDVRDIGL